MKERIKKALEQGKTLYDVCNDYSLKPSTYLEKENWNKYKLEKGGWIREKSTGEIHYRLS